MEIAPRIVVDPNVFVSALLWRRGARHILLRACLLGCYQLRVSMTFFLEEEALTACGVPRYLSLTKDEREALLHVFLSVCYWQKLYYAWRPNLSDEADNHLVAVAGGATAIVTYNTQDFERDALHLPDPQIIRPA